VRYQIQAYGCQMNKYDALLMERCLLEAGHVPSEGENDAEIILLVTCTVRDTAESRIYGRLGQLRPAKESGRIRVLGICGCMAQASGREILKKAPHVDLIVGTEAYPRIAELVDAVLRENTKQIDTRWYFQEGTEESAGTLADTDLVPFSPRGPLPDPEKIRYPAFVTIIWGCNYGCTYCVVPSVRGRELYRPAEHVVEEVRRMAEVGYRSVTLIGQVVNSYRCGGVDLAGLLRRVSDIPGMDRILFVTSHPRNFPTEIIGVVAERPNLVPYFHLPIQSGSDRILKRMARRYRVEDYRRLAGEIRDRIPGAAITSDLIVGFPGETDADHAETLALLEEIRWDGVFSFRYSPRRGTPAAGFPDPIPERLKIERLKQAIEVQKRISLEINQGTIGTVQQIFIESTDKTPTGRSRQNRATIVTNGKGKTKIGQILPVRITEVTPSTLYGEME
jgi:tRNA-2-methylthio-N6-dimethylallyladenosine synthase